jgi:hypothetical protein
LTIAISVASGVNTDQPAAGGDRPLKLATELLLVAVLLVLNMRGMNQFACCCRSSSASPPTCC